MLKPIGEWILTEAIEQAERTTPSGLVLPVTAAKEKTKLVRIISFGPESNPEGQLKTGDIVLVPSHTGLKVEHENKEYEMAKETNFLGVLD